MDMLVKLYDLPDSRALREKLVQAGVSLRRALAPEKHKVIAWVKSNFSDYWASEAEVAFSREPVSCFIAVRDGRILGFACHDVTCRNFFGPTGVDPEARKAGIGTALGVFRVAVEQGKKLHVLVPETRPYLQGARLTAWELHKGGIPLTLITDNMVGHFLKTGTVGAIVTGADRVAANGDTANKIGTYQIAVLAKENNVPFYIAAPVSTFDLSIPDGSHIPIEERSSDEVVFIKNIRIAPDVKAAHPGFDVTPARYITAIITERGIARAPYTESLRALANAKQAASV